MIRYPAKAITDIPDKGFTIYFGEVADSLRTARKRTIADLTKSGYAIITNIPPSDEATAHEQKVAEAVQHADLSVHLLDQFPGPP